MKTPYSTASIPDELLAKQDVENAIGGFNIEAARVSPAEVEMLIEEANRLARWNGEERRCPVERRAAYKAMRMEDCDGA